MITFIGFVESGALSRFGFKRNPNDPSNKDPRVRATNLHAEIASGRLAILAIIALLVQNGVTGTTGLEMYGFGENSGVIWLRVLFPSLAAFGIIKTPSSMQSG